MKIAIISDVHGNQSRLLEVLKICKEEHVAICICCGDVGDLETLDMISKGFEKVYFAFGNVDFSLKEKTGLYMENIIWDQSFLEAEIDELKIAVTHYDHEADSLALSGKYNFVFYGHTHTPWEKRIRKTTLINPGEVAGKFGRASFAIFDTKTKTARLEVIN